MTFIRSNKAWGAIVAGAILATGGMAGAESEGPVRMSGLKVSGLAGYQVIDAAGLLVGEIARVETDGQGRTRWLDISLNAGGNARVASFRADLDAGQKMINLRLSQDLLIARADAAAAALISLPSV